MLNNLTNRCLTAHDTMIHKLIAFVNPSIVRKQAMDWQVDFSGIYGLEDTVTTVSVNPQCLFRCEKIMATDSYKGPQDDNPLYCGRGTRIGQILIGQRNQRPTSFCLTHFFASNAIGNGMKLATCQRELSIAVQISFIKSCTFDLTMFGKCVD